MVQLDEPGLPAVIAGNVPTASRLNRLPVPEASDLEAGLGSIISAARAFTVVHCCALSVPFGIIKGAGADGVGCDLSTLEQTEEDGLAEAVEAGLGHRRRGDPGDRYRSRAGAAARGTGGAGGDRAVAADGLARRAARRRGGGAGPGGVAAQVVLAPACGMAGATPGYARAAMARCREAARLLPELIEEERT